MTIAQAEIDAVSTPATVDTRFGEFRFPDGVADAETADTVYDHLDLVRGIDAFLNSFQGVSMLAIRKGFRDAGVADGDVLLFSGLMDSHSLFLTGNADTVYFLSFVDLSDGPVVFEAPPGTLGLVNDMWFRWVIDVAFPARIEAWADGSCWSGRSTTGSSPRAASTPPARHERRLPSLPRVHGWQRPGPDGGQDQAGHEDLPVRTRDLRDQHRKLPRPGRRRSRPLAEPDPPEFIEGTGKVMNTLPPNDFSFYELLDELVQSEPPSALDPEIAGHARSIGIVKGKEFNPDARMRATLEEAAVLGNATARTISTRARADEGFLYYDDDPDSSWFNPLFAGGYSWMDPPPEITPDGVKPYPVPARGRSTRGSASSTSRPGTPRRCACA